MSTPKLRYLQDLERDDFAADSAQKNAIEHLDELYQRLVATAASSNKKNITTFFKRFFGSAEPCQQGLYLWGGVGRGKTYLMDSFFETLPLKRKMRVHFHRFMRRVHSDLKDYRGFANPLEKVAEKIAGEATVICFDEFFVSDITDAMLLGNLLRGLFHRGVCLVATSNIPPDRLYLNGLQRQQFLPAIALLKKHCMVINVDGGVDHRLRKLEKTALYHHPLSDKTYQSVKAVFDDLRAANTSIVENTELKIGGRLIAAKKLSGDTVWFNFSAICEGPRSQNDYIDIAREFHAVVITDVPELGTQNDDAARRFINLVDEFYDRNVKLIITAAKPVESLYRGGNLSFEFERTKSRIIEMQSHQYLARAHRS